MGLTSEHLLLSDDINLLSVKFGICDPSEKKFENIDLISTLSL